MQSSIKTMRSTNSDRVLVIMARAPRSGAVKTRLAPSLSPEAVTDFYCCLLDDTLALARSLGDVEVAIMCPQSDVDELAQLAGDRASLVAQKGEALGLSVGFADPFYDIDVADDLTRLAAELRLAPARAPRTAAWLKQWGSVAAQLRTGTAEL